MTFGRLTVIRFDHSSLHGESYWLCKCQCGKETIVRFSKLKSGRTKSCGCGHPKAKPKPIKIDHRYHPDSLRILYPRIYRIWQGMKSRCYYQKNKFYRIYGGRGIRVCNEWRTEFGLFCEWALKHDYADNLTIDRIDVNGNYEPSNCRWITNAEQQRNRRNNKKCHSPVL